MSHTDMFTNTEMMNDKRRQRTEITVRYIQMLSSPQNNKKIQVNACDEAATKLITTTTNTLYPVIM